MQVRIRDVKRRTTLSAFPRSPRPEVVASVGRAISMLVMLVGALVVAGWAFDVPALKSILPNLSTMKPNTALAFVLIGASLRLSLMGPADRRARTTAVILAGLVALLALLTLGEYIFGWNLHIDEVLVKDTIPVISPPGRMGPNTAVAFVLVGLATLVSNVATPLAAVPAQIASLIAAGLGLVALLGYVYSVKSLYGFASYTGMAVHTAAVLVLLSIGILTIHPRRGLMTLVTGTTAGGLIVRRMLPGIVGIPIILGWLRLQGQHAGWYDTEFGTSIMVLSSIVTLGLLVWWTAKSIEDVEAQRTTTQQSLRENEGRFRLMFTANPLPMWVYDLETLYFLDVNDAAMAHYGYSRDEFIRMRILDIRPAEDVPRLLNDLAHERPTLQNSGEWRHRRKSGDLITVQIASYRFSFNGRDAVLVVANDVTDRKRAESALRASDARKTAMLNTALDAIITIDHEGKIVEFNPAAERIFGYTRQDVLGRPMAEFIIPPALREQHYKGLAHYLATREGPVLGKRIELMAMRAGGAEFPVELAINPIIADGPPLFTAYLRDITDRRRTEEERLSLLSREQAARAEVQSLNQELEGRVADRTAQLEAANKELESFSYSVAHDLRAPLRAMDGFSRLVVEDYAAGLPEEGQRYLRLVRENAQQMGRLIDDLLAFARLSRQPLHRQRVNTADLVQQVLTDLRPEHKGREIDIQVGALAACHADPALLKQVFANLLSNAIKFTRKQPGPRIAILSRTDEDDPVYLVKDNGVGFDMRYAGKLFGVFQRLHRAEEYEGTGVGLAIVQRIVHRHGGRVWAEADVGEGATFYFTLGGSPNAGSGGNSSR